METDGGRAPEPPYDLGDGLVLRRARREDAEPLAAFLAAAMGDGPDRPDEQAAVWARDLLRGDHPTATPADSTVVTDARGRIVSSCLLIPQVWSYDGVPFGVGRPELVATDPAFRRRGLVRAQFAALHARSAALGHRLQTISGIPWFYRQFGYAPALVGDPARLGSPIAVPALAPGDPEPYRLRPAGDADLPLVQAMHRRAADRVLVSAVRGEDIWRYELRGRTPGGDFWHALRVIESAAGEAVGVLAYRDELRGGTLHATLYELVDGGQWRLVTPSVLRALRGAGEAIAARDGERFAAFGFDWCADHPVATVAAGLLPGRGAPFAWYVRLGDPAGFLRHVGAVLDRRLAASPLAGFTGDARLTFYRDGLRLGFADGRLVAVDPLGPLSHREADAGFPTEAFLALVLGSRTRAELRHAFPGEAWVRGEATAALLDALFPKRPSAVWPIA